MKRTGPTPEGNFQLGEAFFLKMLAKSSPVEIKDLFSGVEQYTRVYGCGEGENVSLLNSKGTSSVPSHKTALWEGSKLKADPV